MNENKYFTINNTYLNDKVINKSNINKTEDNVQLSEKDKYVKLTDIDLSSKNNGMLTKVWGPPLWIGLHAITFGYPYKIDEESEEHQLKKKVYYDFFKLIGEVLPCKYCRQSYKEYFQELDLKEYLHSRESIVRWLYLIHEKVNDKLKVPDCDRITFYDFTKKYETYRAKCKPDSKEQEYKKKMNEDKGCIKPLDNTPKRAIVNVIKCAEGDITRRNNAYENWTNTYSSNNYILIHKKWFVFFAMIILLIICIIVLKYIY